MKLDEIFRKPSRKEIIVSVVGYTCAVILFVISFIINETKKATSAEPAALIEALH